MQAAIRSLAAAPQLSSLKSEVLHQRLCVVTRRSESERAGAMQAAAPRPRQSPVVFLNINSQSTARRCKERPCMCDTAPTTAAAPKILAASGRHPNFCRPTNTIVLDGCFEGVNPTAHSLLLRRLMCKRTKQCLTHRVRPDIARLIIYKPDGWQGS